MENTLPDIRLPDIRLPNIRIGQGFDIHPWTEGRPFKLGGATIPHTHGLAGHSDGDALCHAITDALLGAAGLGDIGHHFPDTDKAYRNANSAVLLQQTVAMVLKQGYYIINIDTTVITEVPKLATHLATVKEHLCQSLGVDPSQINVKAKTHEKFDAIGTGKALAVQAVVLIGR